MVIKAFIRAFTRSKTSTLYTLTILSYAGIIICAVIIVCGLLLQESFAADRELTLPPANTIVQRNTTGTADVNFSLTPGDVAVQVSLFSVGELSPPLQTMLKARETTGRFSAVAPGWYELCLEQAEKICRRIGVGEVFLVAGQSNAVSPTDNTPQPISTTGMVAVSAHHGDGPGFESAPPDIDTMLIASSQVPVRAGACWVRLGDLLAEKYKIPFEFIIVAKSNTNTDCWNPDKGTCWPVLAKALTVRRFRAILWHQGESDVMAGFPMEQSLANMEATITASRQVQPDILWFVARNSLKNATAYVDQPVRKAQEIIIASGQACAGPDTDVIREHPDWVGVADFGGEGVAYHGELWFPAIDACLSDQACSHHTKESN